MNNSAPTDDTTSRVECVIREYPPQTTTSQLGDEMVNAIQAQAAQLQPRMFDISGEKTPRSLSCRIDRAGHGWLRELTIVPSSC